MYAVRRPRASWPFLRYMSPRASKGSLLLVSTSCQTMATGRTRSTNGDVDATMQKPGEAQAGNSLSNSVQEGLAKIFVPEKLQGAAKNKKPAKDEDNQSQSVFYNPIQQFNRDLSVLAIKAFGEDLLGVRKLRAENSKPRSKKRKRKDHSTVAVASECQSGPVLASEDTEVQKDIESDKPVDADDISPPTEYHQANEQTMNSRPNDELDTQENPEQPLKTWKPHFKILDALSATGLRAIRYAKEIPFATSIVANDMSLKAAESITSNVQANGLGDKISVTRDNAMSHMYAFSSPPPEDFKRTSKYDVIDLDPYGTAAPFLDAAMQAINDGGLLCVTCTDAGVWASCGYPEKTYALYGGLPVKGHHSHEAGLRLILHAIASSAARYGLSIEPLLSLSIDFYGRLFVRIFRSQAEVKLLSGKTMLVYTCDAGCGAWSLQPLAQNKTFTAKDGQPVYKHSLAQGPPSSPFCSHCGIKTHISGPMYGGPIHNPEFIKTILGHVPQLDPSTYATIERIQGMLSTALEETFVLDDANNQEHEDSATNRPDRSIPRTDPAKVDRFPFFLNPSGLAGVLHCRAPSEAALKGALKHAGYRVSKSHAKPGSIKTNAPWSFIWDMMREWVRRKAPIKEGALKPGQAGWAIMQRQATETSSEEAVKTESQARDSDGTTAGGEDVKSQDIIFDEELGRDPNRRRLVRYQVNPRANWGPMHRAPKGGH